MCLSELFMVETKAPKAKGKAQAKVKPKSKAQNQRAIATQPINNMGEGKVVYFFYGKFGHWKRH